MENDKTTRRTFLAAASAVALSQLVDSTPAAAAPNSPPFKPGEIPRNAARKKLQGVLQIKDGKFNVTGVGNEKILRYFDGHLPGGKSVLPPLPDPAKPNERKPGPGPTLRAQVGDTVNITFLNSVDISQFHETIDKASSGGCDVVGTTYPKQDAAPDCFHGSSTGNLHFHGTHVTPNGLGDNVLVQVMPDKTVTEAQWSELFGRVFAKAPTEFSQMPRDGAGKEGWWTRQSKLLKARDDAARKLSPTATPVLPIDEGQIKDGKYGKWPEYIVGAYPNCFQIPDYATQKSKLKMGQSPGTHWYHAHKHGSTSIHLFNGLAGAFIIEGKEDDKKSYDQALRTYYGDGFVENILVFQQIRDTQNLMLPAGTGPGLIFLNGDVSPVISMRPLEVQLWRIVNATVSRTIAASTFQTPTPPPANGLTFQQIAQDGVQFKWENVTATGPNAPILQLAPGNRVDVLVQAPASPGNFNLGAQPGLATQALVRVNVSGQAISPGKGFIPQTSYPEMPPFLVTDIAANIKQKDVKFGWEANRLTTGPSATSGGPHFTIDHVQFSENRVDHTLMLDSEEEWTLYNYTSIPHPYHIHVNPFQVVEMFDPKITGSQYQPTGNFVWQDVVAIPAAKVDANGNLIVDSKGIASTPGWVKIRQRFADFPGVFVLHCHILAHEDRGMMQLVEVEDPKKLMIHHH